MSEETPESAATPAQEPGETETRTDWKAEARKWEQRAKSNEAKVQELSPKAARLEEIEQSTKSDLDKANEAITRWQTRAEKLQQANVAATVRALAAPGFADPTDAINSLDLSKYVGIEDEIDEAAITDDLSSLLESKPHYRRSESNAPRIPAPNPSQGASGSGKGAPDPRNEFAAILGAQLK